MFEIVTKGAIEKLKSETKKISGPNLAKATSRALNHTLGKANTQMNRSIRNIYNISLSDLNDNRQKFMRRSSQNSLTAFIFANEYPLSLSKFNPVFFRDGVQTKFQGSKRSGGFASQKKKGGKSGVTVEIIKGKKETIHAAFLLFSGGAKAAVFARGQYGSSGFSFGKERLPIAKLNTKSVFNAAIDRTVKKEIKNVVDIAFTPRLAHEISRLT